MGWRAWRRLPHSSHQLTNLFNFRDRPYDMTDANSMAASSDLSASSTSAQLQDQDLISSGQFAIVRKVGGEHLRLCRITNGQRILIEKLSFDPVNAIGKPYGMFEVSNGGKLLTPFSPCPPTLDANETPEPDSTQNRDQKDSNLLTQNGDGKEEQQDNVHRPRQKMTEEAIDALKSEGISTSDLVSRLVQGNFSFQDRTPFSKQKYVRKKTRKHSDRILISKPSIRLLCQTYYSKDPERLCHLRLDQLGLLLQFSAVHSGGCNVLVFEQTLGLAGAAILERLGGRGSCIFLHKGDWPQSIPCLDAMDFGEEQKQTFLPLRITTLLQPQLAEEEQKDGQSAAGEVEGKEEPPQKKAKTTEDSSSKFLQKKLQRSHKERTALALIQPAGEGKAEGRLDAICIACRTVCPVEILERTFAGLRLSGSVVVYSPLKHHVLRAFQWLRSQGCVNIQLSQQSCRAHQVLPNRTHPLMQQPVTGGYILHATKVMMPLPSQHSQQQQQRMETDKMEMETS